MTFDPFLDNAVYSFGLTANVSYVQSFVMDRSFLSYILLIYRVLQQINDKIYHVQPPSRPTHKSVF